MAMKTCEKCGKTMNDINFYTYRNGDKTSLCKKCLTMHIDNFDPDTYLWILEKMDVPYIKEEWSAILSKAYDKDPSKVNGMSVLGKYLSKMKLKQHKDYRWADSDRLNQEREQARTVRLEEVEEKQNQLKKQFEEGAISESEYSTLMTAEEKNKNYDLFIQRDIITGGEMNPYQEENFMKEEDLIDLGAELTKDDKIRLAMKWGRLYKPSEWVELEKKYNDMKNSFDIQDSDTEGTLILICKNYLKMNQALDSGDQEGYQKLSKTYNDLRKSAKFTAAQNKEEKGDFVDSVGELVEYCEKEGGKIPRHKIDVDYDIIDTVIKDLKEYTKSLIYEDTALARQIEDFIQKSIAADEMKKDRLEAKEKGLDAVQISDEDYMKHLENIEEDFKQDNTVYHEGVE